MKKVLIFTMFFVFAAAAYAENYSFKANAVDEIEIVISAGTLNISSGKTKDIIVDFSQDKPENTSRNIRINPDRELEIFLDGIDMDENTIVNITVPSRKADIEINSASANVNVSGVKGSLNIDAMGGTVKVSDFVGDFDLDTANAEASADGIFKDLDIETSGAAVFMTFQKIPALYDYDIEGAGKITMKLPPNFAKAKLKVQRDEFSGTLNIE